MVEWTLWLNKPHAHPSSLSSAGFRAGRPGRPRHHITPEPCPPRQMHDRRRHDRCHSHLQLGHQLITPSRRRSRHNYHVVRAGRPASGPEQHYHSHSAIGWAIGWQCLGIFTVFLLSLLEFSVKMTVSSPRARRGARRLPPRRSSRRCRRCAPARSPRPPGAGPCPACTTAVP